MSQLKREIHIRQAMVLEDRQLLAAHADALRGKTMQTLASPKALLGGFGAGLVAGMLSGRRKRKKDEEPESTTAGSPWLHLLVRDVAMPLAMSVLHSKVAGGAEEPEEP